MRRVVASKLALIQIVGGSGEVGFNRFFISKATSPFVDHAPGLIMPLDIIEADRLKAHVPFALQSFKPRRVESNHD